MLRKNAKGLLACLMVIPLMSCENLGAGDCVIFTPVYVSAEDVFTDLTARQILANNEAGAEVCGWQRSKH